MARLLPLLLLFLTLPGYAGVIFSTGLPDGRMAMGSMPGSPGQLEIEAADDFLFSNSVSITGAKFYGLIPAGVAPSDINQVVIEVYRVFPKDSVNPPDMRVPTRVNSPSDVAFDSRNSMASQLSFTASILGAFTTGNSVLNGINPKPNQMTGGEGPQSGVEVEIDVTFATPFMLPADHYFFVPQVGLDTGDFFWLSAPKPIVAPGNPFTPDLQAWIRNANLAPDWLRVGTDIVGAPPNGGPAPTFNGAFELDGTVVPEPSSLLLLGTGLSALVARLRKR